MNLRQADHDSSSQHHKLQNDGYRSQIFSYTNILSYGTMWDYIQITPTPLS
jgi:hypothetical protein